MTAWVVLLLLLFCLLPAGCGASPAETRAPLLEASVQAANVIRVQIVPDFNENPRGSNPAKDLTDPKEIAGIVSAFQQAFYGKAIDRVYGNASVFRFFLADGSTRSFRFSKAEGHPAYRDNDCVAVTFEGEDPWQLYDRSSAPVQAVDGSLAPTLSLPLTASNQRVLQLHSDRLGKDMPVTVHLPAGYDGKAQYPVLYMLHGYSGNETSWIPGLGLHTQADALVADGSITPLIIVAPGIDNSWGINSADRTAQLGSVPADSLFEGRYEDYLIDELIPWVDTTFSTEPDREHRFIGGLSMGGCAALHLAFGHPDLFSRTSGHSPALFVDAFPSGLENWLYPTPELRAVRDPLRQAQTADLAGLSVWLDCGDEDSYAFYEGCALLEATLKERGVPVTYHLNPGRHDGDYWSSHAAEYLRFHAGTAP